MIGIKCLCRQADLSLNDHAEVAALAPDNREAPVEDILANGLMQPIVVDEAGVLIDGRNRLAACEMAGVEPAFQPLNGHDAAAFIVSSNLARRNLSKTQQAMALAMIYPEPEKGGRGKRSGIPEGLANGISKGQAHNLLSQVRAILRHSTELAQDILHGGEHFDTVLKRVQAETQRP